MSEDENKVFCQAKFEAVFYKKAANIFSLCICIVAIIEWRIESMILRFL